MAIALLGGVVSGLLNSGVVGQVLGSVAKAVPALSGMLQSGSGQGGILGGGADLMKGILDIPQKLFGSLTGAQGYSNAGSQTPVSLTPEQLSSMSEEDQAKISDLMEKKNNMVSVAQGLGSFNLPSVVGNLFG